MGGNYPNSSQGPQQPQPQQPQQPLPQGQYYPPQYDYYGHYPQSSGNFGNGYNNSMHQPVLFFNFFNFFLFVTYILEATDVILFGDLNHFYQNLLIFNFNSNFYKLVILPFHGPSITSKSY